MAEPVTQGIFFERVGMLEERLDSQHSRLRDAMDRGFESIEVKFTAHVADNNRLVGRVQRLEDAKVFLDSWQARRTVWLVAVVSPLSVALFKLLDHFWK